MVSLRFDFFFALSACFSAFRPGFVSFIFALKLAAAAPALLKLFRPLPVNLTAPAAGMRSVNVTAWPFTFAPSICTPHPATSTVVLTSTFLPFWPRIVPVRGSAAAQVLLLAASAEFEGDGGSDSVNDVIG